MLDGSAEKVAGIHPPHLVESVTLPAGELLQEIAPSDGDHRQADTAEPAGAGSKKDGRTKPKKKRKR